MAWFVKIWKNKGVMLDLLVQRASEAEAESAKEYAAAVCIQSWFRGCILRGYITHLHSNASTIQKNYKGHLGREDYRKRLRKCLDHRRVGYYRRMATRIQSVWRGCYVRKYVFNYRAYKEYLKGVVLINEIVRCRTKEEWSKVQEDRAAREERLQELRELDMARRHHYLLGTQVKQGIFKPDSRKKSHPIEDKMRSIHFAPPPGERGTSTARTRTTTTQRPQSSSDKTYRVSDNTNSAGSRPYTFPQPIAANQVLSDPSPGDQCPLPPLVKVPGPFKPPEEVRRLKTKPLNPTLRASTVYDCEKLSRMNVKAKEWQTRLIEEKFHPFSRMKYNSHQPSIFTGTSYHALNTLSAEQQSRLGKTHPVKAISSKPFKTWIKPIVTFDEIDHTYYH